MDDLLWRKGRDRGQRALPYSIVLGTFSKTVTPGMRIGFVISENTKLLKNISIARIRRLGEVLSAL